MTERTSAVLNEVDRPLAVQQRLLAVEPDARFVRRILFRQAIDDFVWAEVMPPPA